MHRWDNIKMGLKDTGFGGGGAWTGLIWLRIGDRWWALVTMAMNLGVL
jgi:hypothetical protein